MDNLIVQTLLKSMKDHSFVGVHTDPDDLERFELGWISDVSQDSYCLVSIDEFGRRDSTLIGLIEDICRISVSGEYIDAIAKMTLNGMPDMDPPPSITASIVNGLEWAMQGGRVVTTVTRNRNATHGKVVDHDDDSVHLRVLNKAGSYVADEIFLIDSLLRLEIDGFRQRSIEELSQQL